MNRAQELQELQAALNKLFAKPGEPPPPASPSLQGIDPAKTDRGKALEVYKEYQANIKQAQELQAEILKGLQRGEPLPGLFMKACQAIANMTGNKVFSLKAEAEIHRREGISQPKAGGGT